MPRKARKDLTRAPAYPLLREYKATMIGPESKALLGAHAIGIGRKVTAGKDTDRLALRFYVSAKEPMDRLEPERRIPETIRFFSRGAGKDVTIVTDVIETPPAVFEVDPTDRIRPVPGGVSVDAISGTAGTLGGWVWDETDDTIVSLSNDHVYGHVPGPDAIQPGPFDGGSSPADKIGDAKRGIARSLVSTNTVDCGIADVDSSDLYTSTVLEIGPAVYATAVATMDMLVEKFGRTTKHTYGEITDTDYEPTVSGYPFDQCLRIDVVAPSPDWSAGGDSGSLVFSQTPIPSSPTIKPVVGLHFGGPQGGTYGIACKIQNVFAQLDLTTICAGAFSAFLDSLFEAETLGEPSEESVEALAAVSARAAGEAGRAAPAPFVARERRTHRARRPRTGIARDLQRRLQKSRQGQLVTDLVDRYRADLFTMLASDGDVRRAAVAAIGPIVAGASTTTEVLERVFTEKDLLALDRLAREVSERASPELRKALGPVIALTAKAEGRSIASVLGIRMRSWSGSPTSMR